MRLLYTDLQIINTFLGVIEDGAIFRVSPLVDNNRSHPYGMIRLYILPGLTCLSDREHSEVEEHVEKRDGQ